MPVLRSRHLHASSTGEALQDANGSLPSCNGAQLARRVGHCSLGSGWLPGFVKSKHLSATAHSSMHRLASAKTLAERRAILTEVFDDYMVLDTPILEVQVGFSKLLGTSVPAIIIAAIHHQLASVCVLHPLVACHCRLVLLHVKLTGTGPCACARSLR